MVQLAYMKYVRISILCVVLLFLLFATRLVNTNPCKSVVSYSVGNFDTRFGISEQDFVLALQEAESVWEEAAGKNLFEYTEEPNKNTLLVNLIYDYRQKNTQVLNKTGGTIDENQDEYNEAKRKYDELLKKYDEEKMILDSKISVYNKEKKKYDEEVDYWNDQGGAPAEEYKELERKRQRLNDQADEIGTDQKSLNTIARNISESAGVLNELSKNINQHIESYNQTLNSTAEEFNEGVYQSDKDGVRINVYQFENTTILARLLTHEFGHAIGLDHVENTEAIMYRLNQSNNNKLTEEDLNELSSKCGLPN